MRTSLTKPVRFVKLIVAELSTDFAKCTQLVETELDPRTIKPTEVIVRNTTSGINASDVNFSAGVYKPGVKPPFDSGFEGLGTVVAMGEAVANNAALGLSLGDSVLTQSFGAFSEYQVVPSRALHKVPSLEPKWLPLEVSGATALLALEHCAGTIHRGETALVTAAAGGTGSFAVQILKKVHGCRVIGTCSSEKKADLLRSLGCDHVINLKTCDGGFSAALKRVAPSGINLCYESVGGDLFNTAVNHLSIKGRLITIGSMSGYKDGSSFGKAAATPITALLPNAQPINTTLLQKSASVRGFFLPHFGKYHRGAFATLEKLVQDGTITSCIDGQRVFKGMKDVVPAVEFLQTGSNMGKVVVDLRSTPQQ